MINLLSPVVKRDIFLEHLNRKVMFVGELVFIVLLFMAVLMAGEVAYAAAKLRELSRKVGSMSGRMEVQQLRQFQQRLRAIKTDVERLNRLQEQHPDVFTTIKDLIETLPASIQLTNLDVDVIGKRIIFSGRTATRSELLLLKDMLQKDSRYGDINLPLANLLKETNIPFTFSVALVRGKK